MCCTKSIRGQFFGLFDHGNRMAQIIQRFHGIDINADTPLSQQFYQLRVSAASFMAWHIEGDDPLTAEFFQRLIDGRPALIQFHQKITTPS